MSKFVIHGGKALKGIVVVSGAKNAALKMLAATILTNEPCILSNVPKIADIFTMIKILESIGAKIYWIDDHKLKIETKYINSYKPKHDFVKKMRASIVLAGPLLGRFKKAEIAEPGGCVIGVRPVYEHWEAFKKLNVKPKNRNWGTLLETDELKGNTVILDAMSVTATENVIMAAVLAKGTTIIKVAASEPEIIDLVKMLKKMGAKISGEKTHTIKITGVKKLYGVKHQILPDRMEIGTYAIAAISTFGNVTIKNIIPDHMDIIFNRFEKAGVNFKLINHHKTFCDLKIMPSKNLHPIKIDARPYPGFPTDLQAPMSILMNQLPKTSKIFETIFDDRLKYLQEIKKMGANVKIIDNHTAEITGPTKLKGANITSFDLRAGVTLILAGLIAKGKTTINNIETIDRGYENIEGKLQNLGASIKRIN